MNSPQYQNGGSAPIGQPSMGMPLAPDLPDPNQLSPLHFRLAEKRAEQSKNKIDLGTVMTAAGQGIGPEELSQHRERAQLYNQSIQLAEQTMNASDEEFDQILGMLDQMQPEDLPMRMRSPQDPWESVAAAVGMLLDKGHAAEYSAIPGMMRDQRDEQRHGDLINAWKVRSGNLGAKRDVLEKRLQYAGGRRAEASKQYFDTIQARDKAEADLLTEDARIKGRLTLEEKKQQNKLDLKAVDAYKSLLAKAPPEARGQIAQGMMQALGREGSDELLEAVSQLNVDEQKKLAETQTDNATRAGKVAGLTARNKDLLASADYKGKRSQMLVKELAVFDDVTAMQLAKGYAYVDAVASLISDRSQRQVLDAFKANSANAGKVLDDTRMHMNAIRESAQAVRKRMGELEDTILASMDEAQKKEAGTQLQSAKTQLAGLQKAFNDYKDVYTKAEGALVGKAPGGGGGGGSTVDGERAKALKALARASSDGQKRQIKALYKQRTGKDLY